ncbi:uncharacterized protein (DUF488 family) [Flavobacterium gossypii]|uniref:Uncharacterized protein (DUF488 family) n=1 Tax=Flavobacterium gossypii TaxID=1646119 RepID=A0ABR6DR45_9FLAO|nr:DUF488 domain-containing protein [Flavobacterium gossypii]MBA9074160.1 uncharacterized protein (DUF488 family) [Flavobacterium gossypii]
MNIYTIGVYGSNEFSFFDKLISSKIDTFIDVRQRRGVRGSKYGFVNSTKLQEKLKVLGIDYIHELNLAPTTEIRLFQKNEDLQKQELKKNREELGKLFIQKYNSLILDIFDFDILIDKLEENNKKNIVFFCVEEKHTACHRHLIVKRLNSKYDFNVKNL